MVLRLYNQRATLPYALARKSQRTCMTIRPRMMATPGVSIKRLHRSHTIGWRLPGDACANAVTTMCGRPITWAEYVLRPFDSPITLGAAAPATADPSRR